MANWYKACSRGGSGAVMVKDETTCIRCAACASRCPTTALTMHRFELYRECVSFPTRNPKLNYAVGQ